MKIVALLALFASTCLAAIRGADAAKAIRDAGLDSDNCYRVRDLSFNREDLRFYLTDGYLILGKPVEGKIFTAVFVADTDTGDAEVIVTPPNRSERTSLAKFADSPNLDEHFIAGAFLFSDDTARELLEQIHNGSMKAAPDRGILLAQAWNDTIHNLSGSIDVRLTADLLNNVSKQDGLFYAAIQGRKTGSIDLVYDPQSYQQIVVGKLVTRDNRGYFDVWTSFPSRSVRQGRRTVFQAPAQLSDYRIDAQFEPDLSLHCTTRFKLTPNRELPRVIALELTRRMDVKSATVDGQPVDVFVRESLRSEAIRNSDNGVFLLVLDQALEPGKPHEIAIKHEGNVVSDAGNGVYFVGARTGWYPGSGANFSTFDMTFRYPRTLNVVANGEITEDRTDGDFHVTRFRTSAPIRFAGFNLGEYAKQTVEAPSYKVEVYANKKVEAALRRQRIDTVVLPPIVRGGIRRPEVVTLPPPTINPDPLARLRQLATDIASAVDFMSARFGAPPLKTLTVSPIPGNFGQGFPGLLYLSTLAYLSPQDRPVDSRKELDQLFYSDLLQAHEVAHQWWGNLITSAGPQHDWLMESLANYSALLFLERHRGRKAVDQVLAEYKSHLLSVDPLTHKAIEAAGPIVWGTRLVSSQTPGAWRSITYEKGSWIMHMLRAQLGDDAFLQLLTTLANTYRSKTLTTEQFQQAAVKLMPKGSPDANLESFFEQWVYGTGVPQLSTSQSVQGKAPSVRVKVTVTQTGVDDDFSAVVPVEVQLPGRKSVVKWVRTSSEPVAVSFNVAQAPVKVALDPSNATLKR